MKKQWLLSAAIMLFVVGCQSVSEKDGDAVKKLPSQEATSEANQAETNQTPTMPKFDDENDRKVSSVRSATWQLIEMKGYDEFQSTYQRFKLSFTSNALSAKAFNTYTLPITTMNDKGVIKLSTPGAMTKIGVTNPSDNELEKTYFKRIQSAQLWRVVRRQLILGSGEDKLVFLRVN